MFNPAQVVIDAFVEQLLAMYSRTYGLLEPSYPNIIGFVGRMALEIIANSDAPYHNVDHTIMVTLVGQEILRGKHIREGAASPRTTGSISSSRSCVTILAMCAACAAVTATAATCTTRKVKRWPWPRAQLTRR
jgi:hypothetical protein